MIQHRVVMVVVHVGASCCALMCTPSPFRLSALAAVGAAAGEQVRQRQGQCVRGDLTYGDREDAPAGVQQCVWDMVALAAVSAMEACPDLLAENGGSVKVSHG